MTNNSLQLIDILLKKAMQLELILPRDRVYFRNQLIARLNLTPAKPTIHNTNDDIYTFSEIINLLLDSLTPEVVNLLGETQEIRQIQLINYLLPSPSIIEGTFQAKRQSSGIQAALDWYHQFSINSDYIKANALAQNICWQSFTNYGTLEITINLAKPEKDPNEIAQIKLQEQTQTKGQYPICQLCIENEGFSGNSAYSSRSNLRMLEFKLNQKNWFFQFSPYAYYYQHAIILHKQHQDMKISLDTFQNFFAFVDQVPHYIIGSNSDIPIVGGSILTHEHYQSGNYVFPIEKSSSRFKYISKLYPTIEINHLNWPLTTLQLKGPKEDLLQIIPTIINDWYSYNNPNLEILASGTKKQRHNAITPILRKLDKNYYCIYLILRNNRCNEEYPLGIFHPHPEHHHLKKENIGLIEAMGLAILPGRLKLELEKLSLFLAQKQALDTETNPELLKHLPWYNQLQQKLIDSPNDDIKQFIHNEVGIKFAQILEDCAVFKNNAIPQNELNKFICQY